MQRIWVAFCLCFLLVGTAVAQGKRGNSVKPSAPSITESAPKCTHQDEVVNFAQSVLDRRNKVAGFGSANFGSDALYFLLRYTKPTYSEALVLFSTVREGARRPPRQIDSLEAAYRFHQSGDVDVLIGSAESPADAFASADMHVMRALLVRDGGLGFFNLLAQIRANEPLDTLIRKRFTLESMLPLLVIDQSEADRRALAERAIRVGEPALAARILSSLRDLNDYYALLAEYSEDETFVAWANPRQLVMQGATMEHHASPPPPFDSADPVMRPEHYDIFRAGYFNRQIDFLNIVFNQTGRDAEIHDVAQTYLAAKDGLPKGDAELAWVVIYTALVDRLGLADTHRVLGSFDLSSRHRHFAGRAQQMMDWVIAKRAIRGFVDGREQMSERPSSVSQDFDWQMWMEVAHKVRSGGSEFAGPDQARMAIELYAMRHDYVAVRNIARSYLEPRDELTVYRDIMRRLDRTCLRHSVYPGEALLLGGQILYRF